MSEQIFVEKLVTFHVNHKGEFDVAIFSGEFSPGVKCYRLRIPVPGELLASEVVVCEVEQAATKG